MSTVIAAATTHTGKVREHNEDRHLVSEEDQIFIVCDGMGGHLAGEVASETAVEQVRAAWTSPQMTMHRHAYAERGEQDSRRALLRAVRQGVMTAHEDIVAQARRDPGKSGMGTTFTGCVIAGGEAIFAHAGDSRAYLVRDEIAMQLSEDHTLLARLRASGIDAATLASGSSHWKGVLTNALGIGEATHVATFIVPLYSGDRLLLCSDGVSEYVTEAEVGQVLVAQPSPARAAQRLIELALDRGGGDNATAIVVKVVEAGETRVPPEQRARDEAALAQCPLLEALTAQQRLQALRIATPRELRAGKPLAPVALGERVAYIVLEGEVSVPAGTAGPGALVYPEALLPDTPAPDRATTAAAVSDVRLLTIRQDDFFELTEEDTDLGNELATVVQRLASP